MALSMLSKVSMNIFDSSSPVLVFDFDARIKPEGILRDIIIMQCRFYCYAGEDPQSVSGRYSWKIKTHFCPFVKGIVAPIRISWVFGCRPR